jgi:hypothetical protein
MFSPARAVTAIISPANYQYRDTRAWGYGKEIKIMHISSTGAIEGGRVLYAIGRIEAASTWHPAHGSPLQENWRELVLRELIRNAEDIDADAIVRVDYQNDGVIRIDETGVKLKRVVATGIAVKLSCAA